MKQPRNIIFRLDVDDPLHIKALQYLDTVGRKRFSSAGDAIATALVRYFEEEMPELLENDPENVEVKEPKEKNIREIVRESIEKELDNILPIYLAKYMPKAVQVVDGDLDANASDGNNDLQDLDEEIDWGFLGDE